MTTDSYPGKTAMNDEKSNTAPHVVLLFMDGVGIGKKDAKINPFVNAKLPVLASLCGGEIPFKPFKRISTEISDVIAVNATLGVAGLPQSGTGQTAIFTGVNGAKVFGRHFGPYPPTVLRSAIEKKNIFRRLKEKGRLVVFANAFPKRFFEYIESGVRRLTVTTLSCQYAGVPLFSADELLLGNGISADFICGDWKALGNPEVDPIAPVTAGRHLAQIVSKNHFTLFEYWLTDHAGHSQNMQAAVEVLERFDEFLSGFMESFNPADIILIIISDHGNIEDLSTKSHTRNRVPCIIAGNHRNKISGRVKNLTHITPSIEKLFLDS
ncbi:MAG: metalloenzyme [Bacteroidetes bacterium]|nr:metalloenzyme [Bacteroidota bacterium]